jgi:hypothetical protein
MGKAWTRLSVAVDRRVGWHRLPRLLGFPVLLGLRQRLIDENLHDTGVPADLDPPNSGLRHLTARTVEGSYNDLCKPRMGMVGSRFGRNLPLEHTHPESEDSIGSPHPGLVSRALLTRHNFLATDVLNLLAVAWIQFEVHDWLSHEEDLAREPWRFERDGGPALEIYRTKIDPTWEESDGAPTFVTKDSHWWDGSQVYGYDPEFAQALRAVHLKGGLEIGPDGLIPEPLEARFDHVGQAGTWWLGLALLHTLFALEHNSICAHLHSEYPALSDQQLYERARLVNAALMAKIHTLEWTPALLNHPTTRLGMRLSWYGLAGKQVRTRLGRVSKNDVISGVPGSPRDIWGVRYALTEEFVAIYRMHPLLPDDYLLRSLGGGPPKAYGLDELRGPYARRRLEEHSVADALYSFGVANAGALMLHNYPQSLQRFKRRDGLETDLGATDILRIRERGVPRYNRFRTLLGLEPARSFKELTDNEEWAGEMQEVYGDDIDRLDLLIGLLAEPYPKGFAFGDTTFRIFLLMASRRLKSDRFFTTDYNADRYTRAGMKWINDNTFKTVLLRHFPELRNVLPSRRNLFEPWV